MKMKLCDGEIRTAKLIGTGRYENHLSRGSTDLKWVKTHDSLEMNIQGMGAELAHCKAFNLMPDLDINPAFLPVFDCITHAGETVDVKQTPYFNGHLLVHPYKKLKAPIDYYCLWIGELPEYRYCGYLTWTEFWEQPLKDLGHGPSHAVPQDKLYPDMTPFEEVTYAEVQRMRRRNRLA